MNVTPAVLKQIERKKEKEKIAADKLKQEASCFNLSAAIFSFSFFLSICLRTAGVTFIALP